MVGQHKMGEDMSQQNGAILEGVSIAVYYGRTGFIIALNLSAAYFSQSLYVLQVLKLNTE